MTSAADQAENQAKVDSEQDNYALDDTPAGRLAQAAAVGIATAYPDWISSRRGLIFAYVLSFFGFGALVAYANAQAEEEESVEPGAFDPATGSQAPRAWAVAVAALLIGVLGTWASSALSRRVARGLRKRGVRRPWTVLGAVAAAVVYLSSELEAKRIEKLAH